MPNKQVKSECEFVLYNKELTFDLQWQIMHACPFLWYMLNKCIKKSWINDLYELNLEHDYNRFAFDCVFISNIVPS